MLYFLYNCVTMLKAKTNAELNCQLNCRVQALQQELEQKQRKYDAERVSAVLPTAL